MGQVLVLDNVALELEAIQKLLQAEGFTALHARGVEEIAPVMRATSPHIILIGVEQNQLDLVASTVMIRSELRRPDIPIVVVCDGDDAASAFRAGVDGVVTRPLRREIFSEEIRRYLKLGALLKASAELSETIEIQREFLRNLTHELMTPMTPVAGYIKLLLSGELGEITNLQRQALESMAVSTDRLRSVIDTLLDLSAIESGSLMYFNRPYDLVQVLSTVVQSVERKFSALDVTLVTSFGHDEACPMRGDDEKLARAVTHVLNNAAKFSPRGGTVAIEVARSQTSTGTSAVDIAVGDNGPGIDENLRNRVIEPFFQADGSITREHGGLGLGLAYAHNVVMALGGTLVIETPPTAPVAGIDFSGTVVRVRFGL